MTVAPQGGAGRPTAELWYAAYGSNMSSRRLGYYLTGGRPPAGGLDYPGCRDARPPRRDFPVTLRGQLYFALDAKAWTGGMAFYDPDAAGEMPARAYLLTSEQFSDIAAQEMNRRPGEDLDLAGVLDRGRDSVGRGCYETLVHLGDLHGFPVLTFTAPWRTGEVPGNRPAPSYLRHLAAGIREAHGWDLARIARYLSERPGAAGHWSAEEVRALISDL